MAELSLELVHSSHTEHRSCLIHGESLPRLTWGYLCRIILYSGLTSENEEWSNSSELSAVFQSSQGHGCWGPPHPDLKGQIILILPIPLKQHAGEWDTSVVIKAQALGNGRKPHSSIVHLLGDNAAHRYTVVKRTRLPAPTDSMRTRGPGGLLYL